MLYGKPNTLYTNGDIKNNWTNTDNIKAFDKKLSFSFKTFHSGQILLFAGYGKEWALTEERLHENCIINIYDICSYN